MEPLPHMTPVETASAGSPREGGHSAGIRKIATVLVVLGLLMPAEVGENIINPNPLRILVTWLLLLLTLVHLFDRLLSVPGRKMGRIVPLWVVASAAVVLVYTQIWFLKNEHAMKRGMWRFDMLWPAMAAAACVVAYGILSYLLPVACRVPELKAGDVSLAGPL